MPITRGQMKRQLRMGGGIMDVVPREQALLGGIKKAVKKVGRTVKKIAKSDIGKAALIGAAAFGIPGTSIGGLFGRASFMVPAGGAPGIFGLGGVGNLFTAGAAKDAVTKEAAKKLGVGETLKIMAGGSLLGTLAAGVEAGDQEAIEATRNVDALKTYLRQGYRNLKSFVKEDGTEDAEALEAQVNRDVSEYASGAGGYAQGGRIGFDEGTPRKMAGVQYSLPFGDPLFTVKQGGKIFGVFEQSDGSRILLPMNKSGTRLNLAQGDTASDNAMQAAGIEGLPVRQNPRGVKELDLRKTGGFIPPVGIKEKEDDIPAMLSNNEFVFTADAVRGAGDGDVNLGAQRMYDTMKKLEAGGRA
jgi:hypothetical protein